MSLPLLGSGSGHGSGGGGLGGTTDPSFASVVLLWEAEGTNGQNTSLSDATGKTITTGGNGAISTAQARLGSTSFSVGTGGCNLADTTDWDISPLNASEFTIEFSQYQTTRTTSWEIIRHWDTTKSWWIRIQSDGNIRFLASSDGTASFTVDFTTTGFGIADATWADVCIEKDATGKIRFYRNGVFKASTTPANSVFFAAAGLLTIESNGNPNGYIDHIRITKGVARYATDTSYTIVESAFPTS